VLQNGLAIKEFREREGWSCAALAEESGIAQSTLSNIENEQRSTKLEVLQKIANALDLPVGAITRERSQVAPRRPEVAPLRSAS
jgi:transcriptional regulator with XRE-family HTH domain